MSIVSAVTGLLGGIAKPVAGVLNKRTERRQAKESGAAKLALAKQNGATEVTLTDAEWEAQSVKVNADSWKDEYVTIVVTSPIVLVVVGAVAAAFGEPRVLEGAKAGAQILTSDLGLDFSALAYAVILAAIGLKVWRQS